MKEHLDLLEVALWCGNNSTIKVLIEPEKWDELYRSAWAWIDETNQERAITLHRMSTSN